MTYKDYKSFKTKHGVIDVFAIEMDGNTFIQIFTTDHRSTATSSATFSSIEMYKNFIEVLENLECE